MENFKHAFVFQVKQNKAKKPSLLEKNVLPNFSVVLALSGAENVTRKLSKEFTLKIVYFLSHSIFFRRLRC